MRTGVVLAVALALVACGSDPSSAISSGDPKKDAIALYHEVVLVTSGCDSASAQVAPAIERGALVEAYGFADSAESACLGTPSAIRRIGLPESLTGANLEAATKAINACDTTYVLKWSAAGALKKVIDGDTSPSALSEIKDLTQQIESGSMLCAGGLVSVAMKEGATEADLGVDKTS